MLSPPYSPHADLVGETQLGRVAGSKHVPKTMLTTITANPQGPKPATYSHSSSADELTDNDYEDEDQRSSESLSQEANIGRSFKRSASDAFLDRASPESTEYSVVGDTLNDTSGNSSGSVSAQSSRSTSPTDVKERRMTTCWDALKTNPAKYLRRERSFLELYPLRRHSWAGPGTHGFASDDNSDVTTTAASAAAAISSVSGSSSGTGRRGRRSYRTANGVSSNNSGNVSGRGRRRVSPFDGGSGDAVSNSNGDDSSVQRNTGLGSAGVRVHDLNISQIKDYSPPSSSLPPGKSLRAEWKGAPMDLSNDPDLHLLHPAEAHLASVLRLPCDVYLDSKRRLFAEKVHRLKQGLPFRRTDSQKACRIDVNKASRLFGAFEKIGWLEDELFLKFLD